MAIETAGSKQRLSARPRPALQPAIAAVDVSRVFRERQVLSNVCLSVLPGEIHALLGPNGAGKTTLLRILSGLAAPTDGRVEVFGAERAPDSRLLRESIGFVPAGDRTFYLRISALENLIFFARLYGLRRSDARARASELLARVGLGDHGGRRVGEYSHGMQKRLAIARALLHEPAILLVDEATHDLDPAGAASIRELVAELAAHGAAVVWTTQRVEEIRAFADRVTVLRSGHVCFAGAVPELIAQSASRRFLVHVRAPYEPAETMVDAVVRALGASASVEASPDGVPGHFLLELAESAALSDALARLLEPGFEILSCRHERPEVEEAFLALTREAS